MEMVLRRMNLDDVTVHGFWSAFRDWAGNETRFPGEVAEAGSPTSSATRRSGPTGGATRSKSGGRSWRRGRVSSSRALAAMS
jgi:hypothetical protein